MANPGAQSLVAAGQALVTAGNQLAAMPVNQGPAPPWAVQLQQSMQQLQQSMQQQQQRTTPFMIAAARAYNATVPIGNAPYVALPTAAGVVPANMPVNGNELQALNGATVNTALQAYGLPIVGLVAERKNRLARHWGITNLEF
ncbi:hypothetical protein TSOC_000773 [Tetrabaena socialis]|uniref:Uncharacterized protein n=1 Tax=Tetrabaena socialis TaxID=47790 RepID=A0A2J8AIG0_9CHLO|nr:hypothetical protein TSOC_000773 [Tetrabaena socialis]|eukprot:PNH12304.1 hypothetical protein TSOC_000773 [Tetrabaena socialis]